MPVLQRKNEDGELNRLIVDLREELEEIEKNFQQQIDKENVNFKQKLKSDLFLLKNEIDHGAFKELKDIEVVNKDRCNEINEIQNLINEMISEFESNNYHNK